MVYPYIRGSMLIKDIEYLEKFHRLPQLPHAKTSGVS